MSVLRLVDRPVPAGDGRSVTVVWEAPGYAPRRVEVPVAVSVADGPGELIRWYLEEYAEFPSDPAPELAARAEAALADLGRQLFTAVFGSGTAAGIWGQAAERGLDRVRIEVDTDPADVPGLPWELLREPAGDRALVLSVGEFVRIHHETATSVRLPGPADDGLRVLLVICRPGGGDDVPFRSVASRLVRGGADRLEWLELDVLRPATFKRLGEALQAAEDAGRPYHVVHFDGHGAYLDVGDLAEEQDEAGAVGVSALQYRVSLAGPRRAGRHGYLLFEDPAVDSNQQLVDGPTLARLLVGHRVPVLVLNACRSAYTEPQDTPAESAADESVHSRIRAYGSLAAEIADAGVAGVVAMRYNVYVVTAAQFVADLYVQLGSGKSLGQAATVARRRLADDPTRHIGDTPIPLQDWVVPTVYESQPLTLLASTGGDAKVRIRLDGHGQVAAPAAVAGEMPGPPDVGFFGRDETLLALDRAFDNSRVVLLHALAGAGKTTTVAEFARWYSMTGGLAQGAVLWTSFEHYTPLDRVLDTFGNAFAPSLEAGGLHWAAVTEKTARRDIALQVLAQVPVLWIWDNVESVAGFPDGALSPWTDDEQSELADFLRDLKTATKAKVLLTSRREEQTWLGTLPSRRWLPSMPMAERLQLARAVAAHLGYPDAPGLDWRPLLRFTGGNPLTITVSVRQAIREQAVAHTDRLTDFVRRLTAGRSQLENPEDAVLGRSGSLAASLNYGFAAAFTDAERAILAMLHLFRVTVDIDVLCGIGRSEVAGSDAVPALTGLSRDAGIGLLDRAVDIGLLTHYGAGYYGIHPALPWHFHSLHTRFIGPDDEPAAQAAARAYLRTMADVAGFYHQQIENGNIDVLKAVRLEEDNLLHVVDLAREHQLPDSELDALTCLGRLYEYTGRDTEWTRLVERILPDYLTSDGGPRPGRERGFSIVTQWRIRLERSRRNFDEAARLQAKLADQHRETAQPYLDTPSADLDSMARHFIRDLAVSEQDLGLILYEKGDSAAALVHFRAQHDLMEKIGELRAQANGASHIGNSYRRLGDLAQAQVWLQRGLELAPAEDSIGRAGAHGALANVIYSRFVDAQDAGAPETELQAHFSAALAGYQKVLDLLPADHHDYLAATQGQLGNLYRRVGDVGRSLLHYQQALAHQEARGDRFDSARTRFNMALLLANAGRLTDALDFAEAAHASFLSFGRGADAETQNAVELINSLREVLGAD